MSTARQSRGRAPAPLRTCCACQSVSASGRSDRKSNAGVRLGTGSGHRAFGGRAFGVGRAVKSSPEGPTLKARPRRTHQRPKKAQPARSFSFSACGATSCLLCSGTSPMMVSCGVSALEGCPSAAFFQGIHEVALHRHHPITQVDVLPHVPVVFGRQKWWLFSSSTWVCLASTMRSPGLRIAPNAR